MEISFTVFRTHRSLVRISQFCEKCVSRSAGLIHVFICIGARPLAISIDIVDD
jgi:hypothetical protein